VSVEQVAGGANEQGAAGGAAPSASIEHVLVKFREVALRAGSAHGVAASEIDEVLQDVRIRMWRALSTGGAVKLETLTRSYVYRAATSAALDLLRRRRARREHLTDSLVPDERLPASAFPAPDQSVLGRETLDGVAAAMAEMQPNRRVAVRLHLMGYDREEIANLLHWSEAKTRNLLYRGLEDLRHLLIARGIGPGGQHDGT
jgi:RNA polymerase sigma-70 factor (ECF subfamily)